MMEEMKATGAALTGLKAAFELSKAFLDVKGAVEVQGKVFELQRIILSAQQDTFSAQESQSALLRRVSELEAEISKLKAWESEKNRYELKQLAAGVSAYTLKQESSGTEPEHHLCPNCYQHGRKSILQQEQLPNRTMVLKCFNCSLDVVLTGTRPFRGAVPLS